MLIETSPLLSQDSRTCTERIKPAKTAVQGAIYQGATLGDGQPHVAQAADHRPKEIGGQVIRRVCSGCGSLWRNAWDRRSRLVCHHWRDCVGAGFRAACSASARHSPSQWGAEFVELRQVRLALT